MGFQSLRSHTADLAESLHDARIIIISALACRDMTAIDANHWHFTFTTRTGDYREGLARTVSAQDHETNKQRTHFEWTARLAGGRHFSVGDCQIWDLNDYQGCSRKN